MSGYIITMYTAMLMQRAHPERKRTRRNVLINHP